MQCYHPQLSQINAQIHFPALSILISLYTQTIILIILLSFLDEQRRIGFFISLGPIWSTTQTFLHCFLWIVLTLCSSFLVQHSDSYWVEQTSGPVTWQSFTSGVRHTYRYQSIGLALKVQCHEIFCFWFFSWISSPPPPSPEYCIRSVSNFFENLRRYSSQGAPPVSTSPAANFSTSFPSVADTSGKQWEQLSNCWQLKMNLKKKV